MARAGEWPERGSRSSCPKDVASLFRIPTAGVRHHINGCAKDMLATLVGDAAPGDARASLVAALCGPALGQDA